MFLVTVKRQDLPQPLVALETHDKQEALEKLKALDSEWTESFSKQRPFRLQQPFYSSFASSLIMEIRVEEVSAKDYQRMKDGFHQEMMQHGFTGFTQKNNWGA